MDPDHLALKHKVDKYKRVLANTETYRQAWKEGLRDEIVKVLKRAIKESGMPAKVKTHATLENLEAVQVTLGTIRSGMIETVGDEVQRHLIKQNGSLIYQQLFNGKIMAMIHYPFIESLGEPPEPRTLGIYRPKELKESIYLKHLSDFMDDITGWEDYDDNEPNQRIGYKLNFTPGPPEELGEPRADLKEE